MGSILDRLQNKSSYFFHVLLNRSYVIYVLIHCFDTLSDRLSCHEREILPPSSFLVVERCLVLLSRCPRLVRNPLEVSDLLSRLR